MAMVAFSGFLLFRFGDMQWRIADVRNKGAGGRIFRFGGKGLAAIGHADDFFVRFSRACRSWAREQNRASENSAHHGLPEPSHYTVLRYGERFIKKRRGT
jgi:hypothetical protein